MNRWRIPESLERDVRQRDTKCVYCRATLLESPPAGGSRTAVATWEHIVNDARIVTRENIARCCSACNASKGTSDLDQRLAEEIASLPRSSLPGRSQPRASRPCRTGRIARHGGAAARVMEGSNATKIGR